ncbi:tumor necrosis factor alpha-induced protein 2-like [Triplophysa dalaica]|uniref:tumor necrosis factor alpha-induced protein 2-like n=1 Tax=Triplophysa dalaica TaxID=1582913 RepID=UPI0024DF5BA6|nr:tumor necrosis factor alpha-induced protein 2-like [Triplophysa dalaica]
MLSEVALDTTEDFAGDSEMGRHRMKISDKLKFLDFRKQKKSSKCTHEMLSVALDTTEDSAGDSEMGRVKNMKISDKFKFLDFVKRKKSSKCTPEMLSDLDFSENLKQNHLAEAQQQLVAAEERLFGNSNEAERAVEDRDMLQKEYDDFILYLRMIIHESFNEDNQEKLKSALTSILQEEAQDRRWEKLAANERPPWRPTRCREIHDSLLQTVVEERMKKPDEQENSADNLSSSLKREVCRMGKQVQKDLLRVVIRLRECYPPDFEICTTYALLYHQAFSTRLGELARADIDFEDCHYILSWVAKFYPCDVLKHKELEEHINHSSLGPLLPKEDLKKLQEQYFSYKETEVKKWMSYAFEKEMKRWGDGMEPELMDGYYFSDLAVALIPLIHSAVTDIKTIMGSESKSGYIICHLDSFLISYMKCLEDHIKSKQENIPKTLSASLVTVHLFGDYVQKAENLFPEETKTACLSTIADIKTICHRYFLSRIHTDLKPLYRKLWTQAWLAEHHEVIQGLVNELENHIDNLKQLKPVCREELVGKLHVEVMVEYVRRMMKRKLKLKVKSKQEQTADLMCKDSQIICSVFVEAGSKEEWLHEIVPKLSEILRLQDPGSLQLEIVTLVKDFPDLSEQHILAILNMKTNLSSSDLRKIKGCLRDNRSFLDAESSSSFFSKVTCSKTRRPRSCFPRLHGGKARWETTC